MSYPGNSLEGGQCVLQPQLTEQLAKRDVSNQYTIAIRNLFDTPQETSEKQTPNDDYEDFVSAILEAAAEWIPTKLRAKYWVPLESITRRNGITCMWYYACHGTKYDTMLVQYQIWYYTCHRTKYDIKLVMVPNVILYLSQYQILILCLSQYQIWYYTCHGTNLSWYQIWYYACHGTKCDTMLVTVPNFDTILVTVQMWYYACQSTKFWYYACHSTKFWYYACHGIEYDTMHVMVPNMILCLSRY